ncbi:maltokinase [soil metagenome]
MIDPDELARLLPDFLPRQRWYGHTGSELDSVAIVDFEVLRDGLPGLVWALVEATFRGGATATFQVPVGLRPLEATERFLEGKGRGFLGDIDTVEGPALVYDALVDPALALTMLARVAPDAHVEMVRPLNLEQSNTSIVYDERLIMKVFRRVADGPNPDVEVTAGLARVGFEHVAAPVATWSKDRRDLAVVRVFLSGATDGWHLALTSLRDLYDCRADPSLCGGDFAPEAARLGDVTAAMHVALAEAFGTGPADPDGWADAMHAHLARVPVEGFDPGAVARAYDRVRGLDAAGPALRIHGDYHLGQTLRTDSGWYVLDLEGEPAVPLRERRLPSSTLRDVAGILRSFHYAAQAGLVERGEEADEELAGLARVWEDRATSSFLDGYFHHDGIEALLPPDDDARRALLDAFLLAKAVYEVGYERAHRPAWTWIPLAAVTRILGGSP